VSVCFYFQSIRQHVVNLHFKGRAAKRAEKLAMDDSQLQQRDEFIQSIKESNQPTEKEVENITDDIGSGCFLSCLSNKIIYQVNFIKIFFITTLIWRLLRFTTMLAKSSYLTDFYSILYLPKTV